MGLTNIQIKTARPLAEPYKLYDEKGLYLLVQPKGGRLWRLKYATIVKLQFLLEVLLDRITDLHAPNIVAHPSHLLADAHDQAVSDATFWRHVKAVREEARKDEAQ